MRLHILSDLHLEGTPLEPPQVEADVSILAGDISTGTRGIDWGKRLSWAGGERPVLYVAGNHEFYGERFPALLEGLRTAAAGSAVQVLENDQVTLGGARDVQENDQPPLDGAGTVRFLGCTMWSDFLFAGPDQRAASMRLCARVVNDYRQILGDGNGTPLTPEATLERHLASRAWLAERLAEPFDGPTVVITHHAPLIRRRPPSQVLRRVAGAFASDITDLMGGERVALWIYGHTHQPADLDVRGTRVLSNPRGYARESVAFDPGATVELRGT